MEDMPIGEPIAVTDPEPEREPEPDNGLSRGARAALASAAFILIPIVVIPIVAVVAVILVGFMPLRGESAPAFAALTSTLIVEAALLGVIALVVRSIYRRPMLSGLSWTRDYTTRVRSLVWMGVSLAVAVMIVSTVFPPSDPPLQDLINTPQAIALFAVYGIAFAPFLEELIFRGFYYRVVEEIGGAGVAVPATALLFTLPHVPQLWGSWPAIFLILVVGYMLSRLRRLTGSLIPPFVVHTVYNSTLFLAAALSALFFGTE